MDSPLLLQKTWGPRFNPWLGNSNLVSNVVWPKRKNIYITWLNFYLRTGQIWGFWSFKYITGNHGFNIFGFNYLSFNKYLSTSVCVCVWVCVCVLVAQSCPTLYDPMDDSLPGSSVHGILQARVLEWVAISFSRGPSQPRHSQPRSNQVSWITSRFLTIWIIRKAQLWAPTMRQKSFQTLGPQALQMCHSTFRN